MKNKKIQRVNISEIFHAHFVRIYKFFYYKTLSRETAQDLASETFLVFVKIFKKSEEITNARALLYTIAKNIFLTYLKTKYKRSEVNLHDFENIPSEYIEEFTKEMESFPSVEQRALKYINMLPEKQKEVLYLRLIEKLSLKEIAQKLNKDMNHVKTTQKRAIKNFKKYLLCTPPDTTNYRGENNV